MLPLDLDGRVAFVTGSARGIGLATSEALLRAGASVVLNARQLNPETSAAFEALGAAHPGRTLVLEGSAADPAFLGTAVRTINSRFKRLDILVNNAGILRDNLIGMISADEMNAILQNNVVSVFHATQTMSRLMVRQKSGSIINLASIIGRRGNAGQFVYGASKAAVIGATLSAAKEFAPKGIRVNAVAPGFIETRMTEALPDDSRSDLVARIGMGRPGTAEDIADTILFLASDLSRYVTGQVIGVDGGLVL